MEAEADLANLEPDTLIMGPQWNGPATFVGAMPDRNMIIIQHGGETKTLTIPAAGHGIRALESPGEPWKAYVAVERLRHEYAKSLGVFGPADQLPHQLKTIYRVSGEPGRIRYLIADEPGGGKTVVASRIIQELAIQRQADRVLIVVPPLLRTQWRDELKRFAGMDAAIVPDDTRGRPNQWLPEGRVLITSTDYAKQDTQMRQLERAGFDLVVVDEAHNLNATAKDMTGRYKLGRLLGGITKHMIFLTATPHRGKSDNFRRLLELLEPDVFSDSKMSDEDVSREKERLFIRHTKNDMVDMDGKRLFLGRSVTSVKHMMTEAERRLYDTVTEYVRRQYSLMSPDAGAVATFAVLIIQKRMASSTRALLETLRRRRQRLGDRLDGWDGPADAHMIREDLDVENIDDMDESQIGEAEDAAAGYTSAASAGDLRRELVELDGLIRLAEETSRTKPDTKMERLKEEIQGIGDDKLLIFSEYRDTLDYLQEHIGALRHADGSPYTTCRIDGLMDMDDRVVSQEEFRTKAQIMLATDAAREGINLQFCHRMVNYDLPWTPISLEQRMGRLHRYGQEHDVIISNMVADGTREGNVMETLFEKIRLIEQQYPTFNVLGQVLSGGDMKRLMADAIRDGDTADMADKIAAAAESAKNVHEMLGSAPVDVDDMKRRMEQVRGQRTDGEHLVNMAKRLFAGLGGSVRPSNGMTRLDVPKQLKSGPLTTRRPVFHVPPERVFARGGAVYAHLDGWISENCAADLRSGSVFLDPGGFDGYVVFHTVTIQDMDMGVVGRMLVAHRYADGTAASTEPYALHGMEYGDGIDPGPAPQVDAVRKAVLKEARAEADRMAAERKAVWDHRRKAGLERVAAEERSLRQEMVEAGYGGRRAGMKDRLDALAAKREAIEREYNTATTLTPQAPELAGWVRVVPDSEGPRHAKPTEKAGMEASMRHERGEGFRPKDVSGKRGIGYDILSTHKDGRRREIEVKASCDVNGIQLTESEVDHVENSEHAVIHATTNAGRPDQQFYVISNPKRLRGTDRMVRDIPHSEIQRCSE